MKKRFMLLLGVVVLAFIFIIPVLAQEEVNLEIKINGVRQGNRQLVFEDDYYIIDGYEELYIDYEVLNYDEKYDGKYYKVVSIKNSSGHGSTYFGESLEIVGNLDFTREFNEYTILLCNNFECNDKIYTSKTIKYKTAYYNEIKDSKIYLTSVKQGGKEIDLPKDNHYFQLNDKQDVVVNLKGENLIDDVYYNVGVGYGYAREYLGSELESGITITHYTNIEDYFYLSCSIKGININTNMSYKVDDEDRNFYFEFIEDDSIPDYEAKLFYTNYEDVEIVQNEDEYGYYDFYVVDSMYHNNKNSNSLSFDIRGGDFLDKPYTVGVNVIRNNELICSQYIDVNGLILNEGYKISIDKLLLELNDVIEDDREPYHMYLMVGDVRHDFKVLYNSVGKYATVDVRMFFENGKKNLSAFRGTGNFTYGGAVYDTNKDIFEKYSSIYLQFIGDNFLDNEMYEYVLEYGYYNEVYSVNDSGRHYDDVLDTGEVSGRILNNVGLIFNVRNDNKYKNPAYRFIVKKGNEVIYTAIPTVATMDAPSLGDVSLSSKNKNLHLRLDDHTYISTRNNPLEIVMSGLGFEKDEIYLLNICYSYRLENDVYEEGSCEELNIKGDDLNRGKAKYKFDKKIADNVKECSFYVSGGNNKVPIQGGFTVKFVDSRELLPKVVKYVVDNVSDLIKNISKNTSVDDFVSNIEVLNNGKVKLFDSNGEEEITDKVGTGMIARVMDEFDTGVLDLDVVVKGDVTGDGVISITDLVKVKKHLAKVEEIEGIYELGGDITGTGSIGITDLVKIAKDVAKIEEVK